MSVDPRGPHTTWRAAKGGHTTLWCGQPMAPLQVSFRLRDSDKAETKKVSIETESCLKLLWYSSRVCSTASASGTNVGGMTPG